MSELSSLSDRAGLRVLPLVGAAISARLAAYQLGWARAPWEPFFGDGSRRVLRSRLSRALPFPDAGLGALGYLGEAAIVAWGRSARGRARRAPAYALAATSGLMALGSAGLVIAQVAYVKALCTLCLASALISFGLAPAACAEAAAWKRAHGNQAARTST